MPTRALQLCIASFTAGIIVLLTPAVAAAQDDLRVPSDAFRTIQEAVDSLPVGGPLAVVILNPGVYAENVRIQGQNVVIAGDPNKPDATVIDGHGEGSPVCLLDTEGGCTVSLQGLTLTGGTGLNSPDAPESSRGGGLAIQNGYSVIVQHCVFEGNHAQWGGGIDCTHDSQLFVSDVVFKFNDADAQGGAISAWASCTVQGCTFLGNSAEHGGHLAVSGGLDSVNLITDSYFNGGRAFTNHDPLDPWSGSGGAILVALSRSTTIRDCIFENNHAELYGGAIGATPHALRTLEECLYGAPGCHAYRVAIEGCRFTGCSGEYGGGIAWVNSGVWTGDDLVFENCIGHVEGGGIYSAIGHPIITDSSFTMCLGIADGHGGGVRAKGGLVELHGCSFEQCAAVHGAGGGVSLEDSALFMLDCTFVANTSLEAGAAIHGLRSMVDDDGSTIRDHARTAAVFLDLEDQDKRSHFNSTQFIDNGADAEPGGGPSAVSLVQDWADEGEQRFFCTFTSCTFDGNDGSQFGGGAIRTDGMWVELKEGEYRNNTTANGDTDGGVMHARRARVQVTDGLFENNHSGRSGGAFYLEHVGFEASGPSFLRNKATHYGGAIESMFGSTGGVVRGTFDGGDAINAEFGGAVDLDPSSGYFQLADCSFENHRVFNEGGAIYAGGSETEILECSVRGNQAASGGGVQSTTKMTRIADSVICGNMVDQVAGLFTDGGGNMIGAECCEGDVDGNGTIDGGDLSQVLGSWGQGGAELGGVDINKDGVVDGEDLAQLLGAWGPC